MNTTTYNIGDKCPHCGCDRAIMVEYRLSPEDYDGISEYRYECGKRYGRWSGKELTGDNIETRYGEREPYTPDTCKCGQQKNPEYDTCYQCFTQKSHD